jgi:hypothetical protein
MYFLLAGVVEKFHYLKMGLAIVLTFIGVKMLVTAVGLHIPIYLSLIFVAVILSGSVIASLLRPKEAEIEIDVDLPPDFDPPFPHEHSNAVAGTSLEPFGDNGQPSGRTAPEEELKTLPIDRSKNA